MAQLHYISLYIETIKRLLTDTAIYSMFIPMNSGQKCFKVHTTTSSKHYNPTGSNRPTHLISPIILLAPSKSPASPSPHADARRILSPPLHPPTQPAR